jgi:hypothetical protein
MEILTWTCHICGKERTDDKISVFIKDTTYLLKESGGTMQQNIRYCNDNPDCFRLAKTQLHVS